MFDEIIFEKKNFFSIENFQENTWKMIQLKFFFQINFYFIFFSR